MNTYDNQNIVLITGGFDPIHSGHIDMIKHAASISRVVIGVNSDEWLVRKKGKPFMDIDNRKSILQQLKGVMQVIEFDDSDDTAIDAIHKVLREWPKYNIVYANGGDRDRSNIPETIITDPRLRFEYGVGTNIKTQSSTSLLMAWNNPITYREWGYWKVLNTINYTGGTAKIKELTINPGKNLSIQRHKNRSEFWYVLVGDLIMQVWDEECEIKSYELKSHDNVVVSPNQWHTVKNDTNEIAIVLEVQYGDQCIENDIERR